MKRRDIIKMFSAFPAFLCFPSVLLDSTKRKYKQTVIDGGWKHPDNILLKNCGICNKPMAEIGKPIILRCEDGYLINGIRIIQYPFSSKEENKIYHARCLADGMQRACIQIQNEPSFLNLPALLNRIISDFS